MSGSTNVCNGSKAEARSPLRQRAASWRLENADDLDGVSAGGIEPLPYCCFWVQARIARSSRGRAAMRALAIFAALLCVAAPVAGSETITYTYDALGRLVKVERTGAVNSRANACYTHDPANNRTNVTTAPNADCTSGGGGFPSFSINDVSASEGGNLVFTVTKAGSTASSFSVNFATANGTAAAGSDYTANSGTLAFASTDITKAVTVATIDDVLGEGDETVHVNLSGATGGATITDAQGIGTIIANDGGGGNQPPVANFDNAGSMSCGDTITVNVVANDTDPDGNLPLSLVSASGGGGINVTVFSSTDIRILATTSGTKSFSYVA